MHDVFDEKFKHIIQLQHDHHYFWCAGHVLKTEGSLWMHMVWVLVIWIAIYLALFNSLRKVSSALNFGIKISLEEFLIGVMIVVKDDKCVLTSEKIINE